MLSQMSSLTSNSSDSNSRYMLSHASSISSMTYPVCIRVPTRTHSSVHTQSEHKYTHTHTQAHENVSRLSSVASHSTIDSDSLSSSNSISIVNEEMREAAPSIRKRLSVEDLTKGMLQERSISMMSDISSHSRSGGDFPSESSSAASTPRGDISPLSHTMSSVSTSGNDIPLMNVNVIKSPFLNSADNRSSKNSSHHAVENLGTTPTSSGNIDPALGARIRNIERTVQAQMDWLKLKQMQHEESLQEVKSLITDLSSMIKRNRADIAYRRMSRKNDT